MFKDIAVVIPVRMGSSRIKNKATLDFGKLGGGEKPCLYWNGKLDSLSK